MAQSKKPFGRVATVAKETSPEAAAAAPAASGAEIERVTELARQSAARAAIEPDALQRFVHLYTRSPYRQWLWVATAIVLFMSVQFGVLSGGLVIPERSGHDYAAGNAAREAAHILGFALRGDGFFEDTGLMAENLGVRGTLVNTTDERIWQVTVAAKVRDCSDGYEGTDCPVAWEGVLTLGVDVPPRGQAELDEEVAVAKLPVLEGQPWAEYEMQAVSTR